MSATIKIANDGRHNHINHGSINPIRSDKGSKNERRSRYAASDHPAKPQRKSSVRTPSRVARPLECSLFKDEYTSSMQPRSWIAAGAFAMFLAVALGAFGAHGLKARIDAEHLATWNTAVQYHALHALALLGFGLWRRSTPGRSFPGFAFLAGIVLFSGSLYGLALGGPSWLGPITPFGGMAFLTGWLALGIIALRE
jgi:uncharacterized membrane protein YgdD (TMEM256/DUF423 family)